MAKTAIKQVKGQYNHVQTYCRVHAVRSSSATRVCGSRVYESKSLSPAAPHPFHFVDRKYKARGIGKNASCVPRGKCASYIYGVIIKSLTSLVDVKAFFEMVIKVTFVSSGFLSYSDGSYYLMKFLHIK